MLSRPVVPFDLPHQLDEGRHLRSDRVEHDVLIDVSSLPVKGIYVLNDGFNGQEAALCQKFNLFRDSAYHEAEAIPGYTWICHIYPGNRWHLDANDPARGDNLRKYLALFLEKLES